MWWYERFWSWLLAPEMISCLRNIAWNQWCLNHYDERHIAISSSRYEDASERWTTEWLHPALFWMTHILLLHLNILFLELPQINNTIILSVLLCQNNFVNKNRFPYSLPYLPIMIKLPAIFSSFIHFSTKLLKWTPTWKNILLCLDIYFFLIL